MLTNIFSIIFSSILFDFCLQICWIVKILATKAAVLIVARAIAGIGYGATYVVVPMYIREISQDSIKGLLGTLIMSAQHIGVLVMYAMGSYLNYHTTLWIVLCFAIATFLLILLIPESPAFLVKIGKFEVSISGHYNFMIRLIGKLSKGFCLFFRWPQKL